MAQTIVVQKSGPGILVRALWFIFLGFWLTGIVSIVAWLAMITVIGLPLGAYLINRIPAILTLAPRTTHYESQTVDGVTFMRETHTAQRPIWQRALWFFFVGDWASLLAMTLAYLLVLSLIGLPIGIWLYNRVPAITTLMRY